MSESTLLDSIEPQLTFCVKNHLSVFFWLLKFQLDGTQNHEKKANFLKISQRFYISWEFQKGHFCGF